MDDQRTPRVEPGIPLPPVKPREMRYPFAGMAVGDSFAYPCGLKSAQHVVARANARWKARTYVSRQTEDGGVRIWRTR